MITIINLIMSIYQKLLLLNSELRNVLENVRNEYMVSEKTSQIILVKTLEDIRKIRNKYINLCEIALAINDTFGLTFLLIFCIVLVNLLHCSNIGMLYGSLNLIIMLDEILWNTYTLVRIK